MRDVLLFLLCCQLHLAAGQTSTTRAYMLGSATDFVSDKCTIIAECDCCYAELVLLTKSTFAIIDRCVNGDTFFAGTYSIKANNLELIFKQAVVNQADATDEKPDVPFVLKKFALTPVTFEMRPCGKTKVLFNAQQSFYDYGVGISQEEEARIRKELSASPEMRALGEFRK